MDRNREILEETLIRNIDENTGSLEFRFQEIGTLIELLLEDNDYEKAKKYAEGKLELARTANDPYWEFTCWEDLSVIAYYMSDGAWLLDNLQKVINAAEKVNQNEPNEIIRKGTLLKIDMWKGWLTRLGKDVNDPQVLNCKKDKKESIWQLIFRKVF